MAKTTNTRIPSNINLRRVMSRAWSVYRYKMLRTFDAAYFARCLRDAWKEAKFDAAAKARLDATIPVGRTVEQIRADLVSLEMSNFIDWSRHKALSLELARAA
ncbi:hypothetical protein [Pelagibacterium sediminicola]|uniref:hypothetical protein n=1 Tax=Pelagibacterium sediminicola TaxID=2248761 RepID=UPI0013004070|nr:hypothetical protein [Pelagibacterium sediminicola]